MRIICSEKAALAPRADPASPRRPWAGWGRRSGRGWICCCRRAGCDAIVEAQGAFCAPCWAGLPFITAPMCAACGLPFGSAADDGALCGACLARPPRFEARAAFAYEGPAREVVLRLKHADRPHLAVDMAGHLRRAAADWLGGDALLVPVPLRRWRLWRRGYNQAAELAKALGKSPAHRSASMHWCARGPRGRARGSIRASAAATSRAPSVSPTGRAAVDGRCIILVDDVLTTGATADACARVLKRAGAASVRLLTLARVVRPADAGHIAS